MRSGGRLVRRLRGPVAVLTGVLSLGLVAGVSLVAGGAGAAEAASASGAGSVTIYAGISNSIGRITTAVTPKISGFTPASGPAGTRWPQPSRLVIASRL